jgi:chemotaxis protein methyltransferase CheR
MDDNEFSELLKYFNRPWKGYRKVRKGVIKRLRRHMEELDCTTLEAYIAILEQNRTEYQKCQAHLLVTISRFFRDKQVWQHLENRLLPELVSYFPQELKTWSAGCACGEEPYSLAILWNRLQFQTTLKIIATDANPLCLERARKGIFGKSSLKALSPEYISSCFNRLSAHCYSILPHFQEPISWHEHDLLDAPPQSAFHLIFLRNNLLTYYQQPTLGRAAERIVKTLMPGGLLVIGAHEKLPELSIALIRDNLCPLIYHRPFS